jgi:hypothetical protein
MCGICGVFEYRSARPVPPEPLSAMTGSMVHRGPDDERCLLRPGVGLGMRMLAGSCGQTGNPRSFACMTLLMPDLGRATPYGVYDPGQFWMA